MTSPPVRPEVDAAFDRSWAEIAGAGARWSADERVAIAAATRSLFLRGSASSPLEPATIESIRLLTTEPAQTTPEWVSAQTDALGVGRYVELAGIVARVVASDTHDHLVDRPARPIPASTGDAPTGEPLAERARVKKTFAPVVVPSAPHSLGAVPSAEAAMNDLCTQLYLDVDDILNADYRRRAFDKTQIELTATVVSIVNECFY